MTAKSVDHVAIDDRVHVGRFAETMRLISSVQFLEGFGGDVQAPVLLSVHHIVGSRLLLAKQSFDLVRGKMKNWTSTKRKISRKLDN